ncbi:protein POLLEN DEFECTIVE IN GUIDANCE 1 isoform X1 [Phalaenopsis equestris]|uniref:protein POLLEN DEFECTIVE IN GUIDANCE 1 isoform X1 n=1 Tax=Phalaenopsis equestris TaxID=78828 RepID=UPI0009E3D55C|nr:protein POLLEN DEFECTIVE IN GUIDANCE 1 isoform X1 [Phalaenopsis equestris]
MSLRSAPRKPSFDLLDGESSGDGGSLFERSIFNLAEENEFINGRSSRRKRKSKAAKKKKAAGEGSMELDDRFLLSENNARDEIGMNFSVCENRSVVESACESNVVETDAESGRVSCVSYVELRQRYVNSVASEGNGVDDASSYNETSTAGKWKPESIGGANKLESMESLDWKKVMAENPDLLGEVSTVEIAPMKYFIGEIYGGNSLRSTISVGNEKQRQRVYNTMFHVPFRCERLIMAGFFFCVDSFLSLLTIMPARILLVIWRLLRTRQFQRPNAAELSDFGCFMVLVLGVATLQRTDISLIYHMIRGQGTVKLYVVYNVLEIFDKLCQSLGEDVLQVLFSSAEGLSNCSAENFKLEISKFAFDMAIAIVAFILHSFILLAQAVTLSTCIIAHNNALLALLVSNNFTEIKSNVFKRVSKDNLHNVVYSDIIERFHITAFVLFVLAQNILEAEGSWFESFLTNAFMVYMCEVLIDSIKHSFLAKFNDIKPDAYSEFLEDLCRQTLNEKAEDRPKVLPFIPIAPACVVIRVLTPIYATLLPYGPFLWRLFWIIIWSTLTYVMLAISKITIGLALRRLANSYLNLRRERKQHVD